MTNTVRVVYVSLKGVKMPKYLIDIPDGTVYGYDDDKEILIFPEKDFIEVSEVSNLIYLPNVIPYEESVDNKFYNTAWMDGYEKGVEAGRDDAWELIKDINYLGYDDFVACFNGMTEEQVFELSYQEVKEKYEAWKKKDKIRVGDEVVYADDPNKEKAIVLRLYQPKQYKTLADILCEDGTVVKMIRVENLAWTGRHFDEVEDLLKKIKEK